MFPTALANGERRIVALVPAYNEEKSIQRVIEDLTKFKELDVVVINDGSTDRTAEVAEGLGTVVINLPYNLGIGGAVQTGFIYAVENNYDIAIQFDGDGQHMADQISKLMEPILLNEADMVVGSRYHGQNEYRTPFLRNLGIKLFSFVDSVITRSRITDSTSGFRACNREVIKFLSETYPQDYPEPESIIILRRNNFRVVEVPVKMRQRIEGRSSITFLKAIYYVVKVVLAIFVDIFKFSPKET